MPSQVASGIAMCSPESDSVPEQQTDVVEGRVLDHAECEQARVGRDPAYDGRFFTGVRTTGIYCRPVCPVRPAHARNVTFFPSAAAAEAGGFRPCLRCRPETAPFCPAWRGSRAIVERAARLIAEEGALDGKGASVEARRVSVSGRDTLLDCSRGISALRLLRSRGPRASSGQSGCSTKPIAQ